MSDFLKLLSYEICAPVAFCFICLYCYYFYLNVRECRRSRDNEVAPTDSEVRVL